MSEKEVTVQIPKKELEEIKDLIQEAINPKVTFQKDITKMKEEAETVILSNLVHMKQILKKHIRWD